MKLLLYLNSFLHISFIAAFSVRPTLDLFSRHLRNPKTNKVLTECIQMEHAPGEYWFSSSGEQRVCGFYVIGDPNQVVQIEITQLNVNCDEGGLIQLVDGWSMNDEYFPSPDDHALPFMERFSTYCGKTRPAKRFRSAQNVALVQYFIPSHGQGFKIKVEFLDNKQPCNMLSMAEEGTFTLRNYGHIKNCTVYVMFPANVQLVSINVGETSKEPRAVQETRTRLMCEEKRKRDYLQLLTGSGLDPAGMLKLIDLCGLDSSPMRVKFPMRCYNTAVRMVSSGRFYNAVTFNYAKIPAKQLAAKQANC